MLLRKDKGEMSIYKYSETFPRINVSERLELGPLIKVFQIDYKKLSQIRHVCMIIIVS